MKKQKAVDILDIIFTGRNMNYGAYELRKGYSRNLSIAVWVAIFSFVLSLTSPFILAYIKPAEKNESFKGGTITLSNLPQVNKNTELVKEPQIDAPPVKTTVKFTIPVVTPDANVFDEYIPTVDQLKTVDPGKKTQQGNPGADDPNLFNNVIIESKNNDKVIVDEKKDTKEKYFDYVEEMPSYSGGNDAMLEFMISKIKYPELAKRVAIEGKVFVNFIVNKDGSISNVTLVKGIGGGCDEEAVRVISLMPKWNPGKQNGVPVNVRVAIPIKFSLQ